MKGTESPGLYPSLLFCVVGSSQKSSIGSKGPRLVAILKNHIPLKKFCHGSVASPVWNVGGCLSEAGPCRKGFLQLRLWVLFVYNFSTTGSFDTGSPQLLVDGSLSPGVSLAVGSEGSEEISKCSEMITKISWGQLPLGLKRQLPLCV